jgi:hypothetical protein
MYPRTGLEREREVQVLGTLGVEASPQGILEETQGTLIETWEGVITTMSLRIHLLEAEEMIIQQVHGLLVVDPVGFPIVEEETATLITGLQGETTEMTVAVVVVAATLALHLRMAMTATMIADTQMTATTLAVHHLQLILRATIQTTLTHPVLNLHQPILHAATVLQSRNASSLF